MRKIKTLFYNVRVTLWGIDESLLKTLGRRFYPLHADFSSEQTLVCTYSAKTNRIRCLHISREETLYFLLLIAIVNDLSETAITFMHGMVKCVGVSADREHGVRGKWIYNSVILSRPLRLMRAGSLVRSAIKSVLSEGLHVTLLTLTLLTWKIRWAPNNASKWQMEFNSAFKGLITVYDRDRTWRIFFFG
jgi:hypothetical protein